MNYAKYLIVGKISDLKIDRGKLVPYYNRPTLYLIFRKIQLRSIVSALRVTDSSR